jgi:hypothetical protein
MSQDGVQLAPLELGPLRRNPGLLAEAVRIVDDAVAQAEEMAESRQDSCKGIFEECKERLEDLGFYLKKLQSAFGFPAAEDPGEEKDPG